MVEHGFPESIIVNYYLHVHKSVINEYTQCLNDKSLKDQISSDIKKLQTISFVEDIEKGLVLLKGNIREKLNVSANLKILLECF